MVSHISLIVAIMYMEDFEISASSTAENPQVRGEKIWMTYFGAEGNTSEDVP